MANTDQPAPKKSLRLWPGVVAAVLLLLTRFLLPLVLPEATIVSALGGMIGALLIVLWWLFFSRAPWLERIGAILFIVLALLATSHLVHISIANGGMGMLFYFLAIPIVSVALVAGAVAGQHLSTRPRRALVILALLLPCGVFTLLRSGGVRGAGGSELHWRWTDSPEQQLLSGHKQPSRTQPLTLPGTAIAATSTATNKPAEWPGFRGTDRNGIVHGPRVQTDWSKFPPIQLWQKPIGPGWSSFAVRGEFFYTQEQRGETEFVVCYKLSNGEPVWRHGDPVRFWESNAGAGPRGTPTLDGDRIYTFGGTGLLNALEATNGTILWSRNVAVDADKKVPTWGFASSPLVIDDIVIVAASGKLAGYDRATGQLRWVGPAHAGSYSSPHRVSIGGVTQVLQVSADGVTSVAPTNGTLLWEHAWPGFGIVQPAVIGDNDVLVSTCGAMGGIATRRVTVAHGTDGWTTREMWTSTGLKPYFNDLVIHKGHAFGFDNSIMACIDLADGKRKWKGGRFGNGQLVLLPDQDVLLVLSEQGELALVAATPDDFKELARLPGIKGKTWNHPVLVGNVLLMRNSEEMAAFRLALAEL